MCLSSRLLHCSAPGEASAGGWMLCSPSCGTPIGAWQIVGPQVMSRSGTESGSQFGTLVSRTRVGEWKHGNGNMGMQ